MKLTKVARRAGWLAVAGLLGAAMIAPAVAVAQDKVYVCHATGQAGTLHFVELYVPATEGGFPQGHFTESGTPESGHEDDYLGRCVETPSSEPSTDPSSEPSTEPSVEPVITPAPTPSGLVAAETGTPQPTLPATDAAWISGGSGPSGSTWQLLLFVMAGLLATILLLTPATAPRKR